MVNYLLPLIDGKGRKIKKLQEGIKYTGKVKGNYILLLKSDELERYKPLQIGNKVFSASHLISVVREKVIRKSN
ncbi:hypothetical protein MYF49_002800 [Enterococcus faecium]|nr:hypothetical protein [Enterococcus faecium]EME8125138.1 hypothetical protein [Enterococcus faecium]